MKKILIATLVAIFGFALATVASAYVVSLIGQTFEVKEPITVKTLQAPAGQTWPGGNVLMSYEIANQADVAYGMSYGGYLTYANQYGTFKFPLEKQPAKPKKPSIRLLQNPETTTTIPSASRPQPPSSDWGQVEFELTINDIVRSYSPYDVVDVGPHSGHILAAKIRPAAEIPPGKWEFYLYINRGEPMLVTTTTP